MIQIIHQEFFSFDGLFNFCAFYLQENAGHITIGMLNLTKIKIILTYAALRTGRLLHRKWPSLMSKVNQLGISPLRSEPSM